MFKKETNDCIISTPDKYLMKFSDHKELVALMTSDDENAIRSLPGECEQSGENIESDKNGGGHLWNNTKYTLSIKYASSVKYPGLHCAFSWSQHVDSNWQQSPTTNRFSCQATVKWVAHTGASLTVYASFHMGLGVTFSHCVWTEPMECIFCGLKK